MNIEKGLKIHLDNDAGLKGVVDSRIYPHFAPQGAARPYVVFRLVSNTGENHLNGPTDIRRARIQFDCIADTYLSASNVADKLYGALGNFIRGAMDDVTVISSIFDNEQSGFDSPNDDSQQGIYRKICDYMISYRLAVPARQA